MAYQEGEAIYKAGDAAGHMYFLVAGKVVIRPTRLDDRRLQRLAGLRTARLAGMNTALERARNDALEEEKRRNSSEDMNLVADLEMWTAEDGEIFGDVL